MAPLPGLRPRLLVLLLRIGAVMTMCAFPTMLLPVSWMDAVHGWLGMGPLPRGPVVDYLARSIAGLYGFHGVLLWIVSSNVPRYRPIIIYLGFMNLAFGAMLIAIDLHAGLPWFWTATEGPPLLAIGAMVLLLVRALPPPAAAT